MARVLIGEEIFRDRGANVWERGTWPAVWIGHPECLGQGPAVLAFRKTFHLEKATTLRVHVSADQRYRLFLDGRRIGIGPQRGDLENWFFETYDLELSAGEHVLVAQVWWLGYQAPFAQMSAHPAFLLAGANDEAAILNTLPEEWRVKRLSGYEFVSPGMAWGTGAKVRIVGSAFDWGFERGQGDGWVGARRVQKASCRTVVTQNTAGRWLLRPATLPEMYEEIVQVGRARCVQPTESTDTLRLPVREKTSIAGEVAQWDALLAGAAAVTIPPHTKRRVIVDLGDYYCAYPLLTTSKGCGASVRIHWAEGLYFEAAPGEYGGGAKGNRDEVEGKFFRGTGDTFEPDGGEHRAFETLWWEAGRYLEVVVQTADEPLVLERFSLWQTHYPHQWLGHFECGDKRLTDVTPLALRAMEMCSHETYMDCPFYEQLMYVGDTRLEVLVTYAMTADDRLPRQALTMFDASRRGSGLTQSRYPSWEMQMIPPFSLWFVGMVHDYLMWRGERNVVAGLAGGVRTVLNAYGRYVREDDLLYGVEGWNFLDWVPAWKLGMPPDGDIGASAPFNWQFVWALRQAADIEDFLGEPELAARNRRLAAALGAAADAAFWDESRGLYADDLAHKHFSEHSQCLAVLCGAAPKERIPRLERGLTVREGMERTTIYFRHYLFETLRALGRMDLFADRLDLWGDLTRLGCRTTLEMPEPGRSDCHAWGAHPVYHYLASVLGIRPAAPSFASVAIQPQLGMLEWARGEMPHPRGAIRAEFAREGDRLRGKVTLPAGLGGVLLLEGKQVPLRPGEQAVR